MGEVSLSRALAVVDQVIGATGLGWEESSDKLRSLFGKKRANDAIELVSSDSKGFVVKYTTGFGNVRKSGLFGFADVVVKDLTTSEVEVCHDDRSYVAFLSVVVTFSAALGASYSRSSSFFQGLQSYSQCLMQDATGDSCEKQKAAFQGEVASYKAKKAAEAERNKLADLTSEAKAIWNKVDTFLEAARKADEDDSDLEKLEKIVARYSAARPVVAPKTLEDAEAIVQASRKMLKEFESHPSLGAFVREEGQYDHPFPFKFETYSLGGYVFTYPFAPKEKEPHEGTGTVSGAPDR